MSVRKHKGGFVVDLDGVHVRTEHHLSRAEAEALEEQLWEALYPAGEPQVSRVTIELDGRSGFPIGGGCLIALGRLAAAMCGANAMLEQCPETKRWSLVPGAGEGDAV